MVKNYKVGIYLRLSSNDGDSIESQSIDNQRLIINNYIKLNKDNLTFVKEYIDDGYSGSNFERPGWRKLINDLNSNIINTVITKDLSRMGRDYIGMGNYIENIFPKKNVRYIAINDDIDTLYETPGLDYLQFKLLFNDLYLKDISKKIRRVLYEKKKEGKYTGWKAPYGYKKINKYDLIIDKETSKIVIKIFDLALKYNIKTIANILNEQHIKTPSQYANLKNKSLYWSPKTIKDILSNEIYIGNLTQGKRKKINYKIKKEEKVDKKDWIIVNKPELAIIKENQFKLVNNREVPKNRLTKKNNNLLLNGLLKCKECKHSLIINKNNKNYYTICSYYIKNSKFKLCTTHSNNYIKIESLIMTRLKQLLNNIDLNKLSILIEKQLCNISINKIENELKKQLKNQYKIIEKIYEDKLQNNIEIINYDDLLNKYKNNINNIKEKLNNIDNLKKNNINSIEEIINTQINSDKINKNLINKLIKYIEIDKNKEITIYYNFIT